MSSINADFIRDFYRVYDSVYGLGTKGACEFLVEKGYVSASECQTLANIVGIGRDAIVTKDERQQLEKMGLEDLVGYGGKRIFKHRKIWLTRNFPNKLIGGDYSTNNRIDMVKEMGEIGEPDSIAALLEAYFDDSDEFTGSTLLLGALASIFINEPTIAIFEISRLTTSKAQYCALLRDMAVAAIEQHSSYDPLTFIGWRTDCGVTDLLNDNLQNITDLALDGNLYALEVLAGDRGLDNSMFLGKMIKRMKSQLDEYLK